MASSTQPRDTTTTTAQTQHNPLLAQSPKAPESTVKPWLYDTILWLLSILIHLFFREVHPRSSWKVPKTGPVIFVAAPHANQFVDPLILAHLIRSEAKRRAAFLIATASLERPFIGNISRALGAVGVGRAQDVLKPAQGKICLPEPESDPTLIKGVGTNFKNGKFVVGGLIALPKVGKTAASAEISELVSETEMRIKKPFKGDIALAQLTGKPIPEANGDAPAKHKVSSNANGTDVFKGISFKVAPKIDQSKVYEQVFTALSKGQCVGIFPEGGSHDRTELLPLKAGVAIMALGAVAADPNCRPKIVPCGMNYFHAHKFRSRAVVEFGTPLDVPLELVEEYKNGDRREAVGRMLELVYNALVAVTVTSPDYDTLMLIQAVRRLYNPQNKPLPLPMVVELNRRLVKGYTKYKDDPRIVSLKKNVMDYHRRLLALNVRDHQLAYAKFSILQVTGVLIYRVFKLTMLSIAVLPGLFLFAPVFIAGKIISIRKAREALANSSVKVQARDVVATWKLLVAMALAPTLYTIYSTILTWWTLKSRMHGSMPVWFPAWLVFVLCYGFSIAITFAALRFGEVGMDIVKSLRPLVLALNPTSSNSLVKLRLQREELATQVTELINELGPELFPDFEKMRLIHSEEPQKLRLKTNDAEAQSPKSPTGTAWSSVLSNWRSGDTSPGEHETETGVNGVTINRASSYAGHIPRDESFRNLGNIGMFSSHPHTPTTPNSEDHSRSSSRVRSFGRLSFSAPGQGFSSLDEHGALDDVSRRIRGAMQERGVRRRRQERMVSGGSQDLGGDAAEDEGSEDGETGDAEWERQRGRDSGVDLKKGI